MMLGNIILHEIMAFEKRYGHKPYQLILCDTDLKNKFFSEIYELTLKTEELDFKNPGEFYGVPFVFKNIWQYGGSCKWMLVGQGPNHENS